MAAKRKAKARKPKIAVVNLKTKSPAQLKALLKRISKAKVGFVVLNAPFKLRAVEAIV